MQTIHITIKRILIHAECTLNKHAKPQPAYNRVSSFRTLTEYFLSIVWKRINDVFGSFSASVLPLIFV